jgi:hypothetical protein
VPKRVKLSTLMVAESSSKECDVINKSKSIKQKAV